MRAVAEEDHTELVQSDLAVLVVVEMEILELVVVLQDMQERLILAAVLVVVTTVLLVVVVPADQVL
jgi:hypothetical protein